MATMKVKATLDSRNYKRGVKEMKRETKGFGKQLAAVSKKVKAAFVVVVILAAARAIARLTMSLVRLGSELSDLSAQTGIAVDQLEKLNDAAVNAGSSQEKMAKALVSLKDAQGEVLSGDKLMTDAFEALGLSIEQVAAMDLDDLFVSVSQALTDSGNSGKELSAVFDLLGKRNAMELTEAMNEVADSIDNVNQKTKSLSDQEAQRLDVIADMWERKKRSIKADAASILASIFGASSKVEEEVRKRAAAAEKRADIDRQSRAFDLAELKRKEEEKRLEAVSKVAEKEAQIAASRAKQIEDIRKSVKIEIDTNAIARIGGFAGSAVKDTLRLARQRTEIQMQIADYTASLPAIEENTKKRGLE